MRIFRKLLCTGQRQGNEKNEDLVPHGGEPSKRNFTNFRVHLEAGLVLGKGQGQTEEANSSLMSPVGMKGKLLSLTVDMETYILHLMKRNCNPTFVFSSI